MFKSTAQLYLLTCKVSELLQVKIEEGFVDIHSTLWLIMAICCKDSKTSYLECCFLHIIHLSLPAQVQQHSNGTRIKLDISVDAPEIIIPLKSNCDCVFSADLGRLTISNSFSLVEVIVHDGSKEGAIVESYDIKLSNLTVLR